MSTNQSSVTVNASNQPDIIIYSHSPLFYWWPVWAVGLIMGILTWVDGGRMAVVPNGSEAARSRTVEMPSGQIAKRDVIILPENAHLYPTKLEPGSDELPPPEEPKVLMAHSKNFGVVWAAVLLAVIFVSNVPLRGLWSIIIIVTAVLVVVIFALLNWWEPILERLYMLRIHMNAGGYFFFSGILFLLWAATFFFFDRRMYMVFSAGQIRVCQEIGEGERVFDATGVVFQKHQNDIFRHWIIGMGAGDLIVRTGGPNPEHFDLPNVLFVGHRVKQIEQRLKSREVI